MRRSRSSSILRSSRIVKEDAMMSVIDAINVMLKYLANNTMNKAAIIAIRDYVKDRNNECGYFGVSEIYDSTQFSPVGNFIANYVKNKNKETPQNEMFQIQPMKLAVLTAVDGYVQNLKNIWEFSTSTNSAQFEKYLQNKLMDVQGFWGSAVILKDHQTAHIISEFNIAHQNNS